MCEQISQLCEGHSVERPVYSFVNHNRIPETVTIEPPCVLDVYKRQHLIFPRKEMREAAFAKRLREQYHVTAIVLAGFLGLVPESLLQAFPVSYTH